MASTSSAELPPSRKFREYSQQSSIGALHFFGGGIQTPWKIFPAKGSHETERKDDLNQKLHEDMFQNVNLQGAFSFNRRGSFALPDGLLTGHEIFSGKKRPLKGVETRGFGFPLENERLATWKHTTVEKDKHWPKTTKFSGVYCWWFRNPVVDIYLSQLDAGFFLSTINSSMPYLDRIIPGWG